MAQPTNFRAAMVRRTYDEALHLTLETRNYLSAADLRSGESLVDRLKLSCEAMRVTARLTQVMAWTLLWRGVEAGELSAEEARSEEYRLAGEDVCLDLASGRQLDLPAALRSLLDRSYDLQMRILRLEELDGVRPANPTDRLVSAASQGRA